MSDFLRNEQIPSGLYKLIDLDKTDLGIKPIAKIREICEEKECDCVLVNSTVKPGIVRLEGKEDDSKKKYLKSKQSRKNKPKEVKTKTYVIDKPLTIQQNDLDRKMNEIIKSVKKNYSVTLTFKAFGRYSSGDQWEDIKIRFEESCDYILGSENIMCQNKRESDNTLQAIFRFTNKK